ncbi:ATP-binding protein [Sphaerisporangium corydalis]|uniref:ATP-binding protein n=1 Tax=Sphaerisporangium corydalis TaxID=1441875 RepID=A0ABV9EA60_9ACTN|nr:ATP-binding protein [Sphaerisporangium corydalis]
MRAEQPVQQEALHRTGVLAEERCGHEPRVPGHGAFRVLITMLRGGTASRGARSAVRRALAGAGVTADEISDTEVIVAELAANSEKHSRGPYELRIHCLSGIPMWCEMVDGGHELGEIPGILARLQVDAEAGLEPFAENGRGLLLAHMLSNGRCYAYPTTMSAGGAPGKAVAFALPAAPCEGGG